MLGPHVAIFLTVFCYSASKDLLFNSARIVSWKKKICDSTHCGNKLSKEVGHLHALYSECFSVFSVTNF